MTTRRRLLKGAWFGLLTIGVAGAAIACSDNGDNAQQGEEQEIQERTDADELPTGATDITLLSAYNSVFDVGTTEDSCVDFKNPAAVDNLKVTGLTSKIDAQFISAHSDVNNTFNVDATLGAKAELAGVDLHAGLSTSFHKANTSYSYLLRASQSYGVVAAKRVALNKTGTDALAAGPDQFLKRCGDSFVSGLKFTATLYILMQFDAPSEESAKAFAAGVSANVNATVAGKGASANGGVDTKSNKVAEQDRVRVNFTLSAEGFSPKGGGPLALPTTVDSKVSSETLAALSGHLEALTASVAADRAVDSTQCSTTAGATCFQSNIGRQAQAARVVRGSYDNASGVDSNPIPALKTRLDRARAYLNAYGKLKFALEDVYFDEIKPFNDADEGSKANFNVAAPAPALNSVQQVAAVVQKVEPVFRPTDALDVSGNVLGPINQRLRDCLRSVNVIGDDKTLQYAACSADPTHEPEHLAGQKALSDYANNRVLFARFFSAGSGSFSKDGCTKRGQQNDAVGLQLAFPDVDATARLGPALRAIGGSDNACVFYNDTQHACGGAPFVQNNTLQCSSSVGNFLSPQKCQTLCVPSTGVFGIIKPLSSP